MACFVVPATEAVVTTVATKAIKKSEASHAHGDSASFSRKLNWLNGMLWGGSALLAFEHVWHGEVSPFFPFLTAMANPADAAEMLSEMATSGVAMAALITVVWAGMVAVSTVIEKKSQPELSIAE